MRRGRLNDEISRNKTDLLSPLVTLISTFMDKLCKWNMEEKVQRLIQSETFKIHFENVEGKSAKRRKLPSKRGER